MSNQEREPLFSAKNLKLLTSPFGQNNPITVQILGICSALAVTAKRSRLCHGFVGDGRNRFFEPDHIIDPQGYSVADPASSSSWSSSPRW